MLLIHLVSEPSVNPFPRSPCLPFPPLFPFHHQHQQLTSSPLSLQTEKIWDLTHAINVKGVWFGCKHAVLSLRKHGKKRGSIINTASVVALLGSATPQLAYTASKGAVLAMTRELAIVHAREGFRFNALCPAPLKYGRT